MQKTYKCINSFHIIGNAYNPEQKRNKVSVLIQIGKDQFIPMVSHNYKLNELILFIARNGNLVEISGHIESSTPIYAKKGTRKIECQFMIDDIRLILKRESSKLVINDVSNVISIFLPKEY